MTKKSLLLWIIGSVTGAVTGYFYYLHYGCQGTCAITSKPLNTMLYGALMGGLMLSLFETKKSRKI